MSQPLLQVVTVVLLLVALWLGSSWALGEAPREFQQRSQPSRGQVTAIRTRLAPDLDVAATLRGDGLNPAERQLLWEAKEEVVSHRTSQVDNTPPSPPGLPPEAIPATVAVNSTGPAEADMTGSEPDPSEFLIAKNRPNILTNRSSLGANSEVAEPVAINDGIEAFYMGNWHWEWSRDGGRSWNEIPLPSGPPGAESFCCDPDVVYDQGRGATFASWLFLNATASAGAVRIWVRRSLSTGFDCAYTFNFSAIGVLPDYPHLAVSNDHLWLATNNIGNGGSTWEGAQVRRMEIDKIVACETTTVDIFTWNSGTQRVFVPVEGARETMYWGMLPDTTTFRIFSWGEETMTVVWEDRAITESAFNNPTCTGGVNGTDWIEGSTAWSIVGFRLHGAVGAGRIAFYWNTGVDSQHPQGHVHAVVLDEDSKDVIAQPHIWDADNCYGYPTVGVNDRGDLGLSIGFGGDNTAEGTPVRGYVGLDDDFTPGVGFFGSVHLVAWGTHNPGGQRYGDYMTVTRHSPCGMSFLATAFGYDGGIGGFNVNGRHVEFARQRDAKCVFGWRHRLRSPK